MSAPRARVVLVQSELRQYRVPFLEELRQQLIDREIALEVLHNNPSRSGDQRGDFADLPWARAAAAREIGIGRRRFLWQEAPDDLWKADLVIVEQASRMLLNYRLLLRRRHGGPKVAFWGHGRSPYPDASSLSEGLKRWVSKQPDWWFAYTDAVVERVGGLGFPRHRITSINNSTDTRQMREWIDAIEPADTDGFRERFEIARGPVGLFVGALVAEKRLEFLVDAGAEISASVPGFCLLVAGDGPLKVWLQEQARTRPWLRLLGRCSGRDLAVAMTVSDALLIPAWVGLVITDGFAAGRPVITSRTAAHPPEVDYLRDGVNGLLVDDGGDPAAYAQAVVAALEEPGLLGRLQAACIEDASNYSVQDMARRCASGIVGALASETRGSP